MDFLTVADIRRRIDGMPDDAKVFAYIGSEGLQVQAEWDAGDGESEPGYGTILSGPSMVPSAGGPVR